MTTLKNHVGPVAGDEDLCSRKVIESSVEKIGKSINFSRTVGAKNFDFQRIFRFPRAQEEAKAAGIAGGVVKDGLGGVAGEDHLGFSVGGSGGGPRSGG